jgi:hypothetical protein
LSPKKLRALSLAALATVAMLVISSCDTSTIPTPTQGIRPGQPAPLPTATVATPAAQATSSRAQSSALPTATNPTQAKATATPERPVTPEQNPAGDIPDTQVFVKYVSAAGGYEFEAPEGWKMAPA